MENIKNGNTYLLNLTFPTKLKTNCTLEEIFYFAEAKYKLYFEDKFVVFSPETFIQINNGKIFSFPMKGTIDASIDNAETKLLGDIIEEINCGQRSIAWLLVCSNNGYDVSKLI